MKNLTLVCEAQVNLAQDANEAANPSGLLEARVTTWGAREGADGRKFNYQAEGFADWAKEFKEAGAPLPMFLNHNDMGMPVGEWTSFEFDDDGMSASGRLYINTVGGSDLYQVLKESPKMFGGVSIGAFAEEAQYVDANGEEFAPGPDGTVWSNPDFDYGEAYFQITKGGLREVSVVMYPNNPEAGISKLEYFRPDGSADLKVFEQALRDAGLAKKDAKLAASVIRNSVAKRDALPLVPETEPVLRDAKAGAAEAEAKALLEALELRALAKALSNRIK